MKNHFDSIASRRRHFFSHASLVALIVLLGACEGFMKDDKFDASPEGDVAPQDVNNAPDQDANNAPDQDPSNPAPNNSGADVVRGLVDLSFEHNGVTRETLLYVPESYDAAAGAPLMLNFHGFGGDSRGHMEWADMRPLADRDGFLLAYPQGTLLDGDPHWNAALPSPDNKSDADDLGFVRELIAQIERDHPLDRARIYASGYSNGGMMAFALACYASDLFAAVGVVSGQLLDNGSGCAPSHPTGVITLHGTNDFVLAYDGGFGQLSVQDAIDFWVDHNETNTTPESATFNSGGMTIERFVYDNGNNGVSVEHYRYVGGDHVWFTQQVEGSDASALVWDFVARHDINGAR